jgi:hypothetical protein
MAWQYVEVIEFTLFIKTEFCFAKHTFLLQNTSVGTQMLLVLRVPQQLTIATSMLCQIRYFISYLTPIRINLLKPAGNFTYQQV